MIKPPFSCLFAPAFVLVGVCACDRSPDGGNNNANPKNVQADQSQPAPIANHAFTNSSQPAIPMYSYQVVNSWPHDRSAFTQGLVFSEGELFESTGMNGQS